jgi:hypothetical protein
MRPPEPSVSSLPARRLLVAGPQSVASAHPDHGRVHPRSTAIHPMAPRNTDTQVATPVHRRGHADPDVSAFSMSATSIPESRSARSTTTIRSHRRVDVPGSAHPHTGDNEWSDVTSSPRARQAKSATGVIDFVADGRQGNPGQPRSFIDFLAAGHTLGSKAHGDIASDGIRPALHRQELCGERSLSNTTSKRRVKQPGWLEQRRRQLVRHTNRGEAPD